MLIIVLITILVLIVGYTFYDYRRHKRPLLEIDPNVSYGYFHHIKVVTIPVTKYRISSLFDRFKPHHPTQSRRF